MLRLALAFPLVVLALAFPAPADAAPWRLPLRGPVLVGFDVGPDRFAAGQHRGVDLGAPVGATVRAACGGPVTFAGRLPDGGRGVSVRCGALTATYLGLGPVSVRRGALVAPGAALGAVGAVARPGAAEAHGPHLHLGARRPSGAYVDPLSLLGQTQRPPFLAPLPRPPRPTLGPAPRSLPLSPPAPASARPLAHRGAPARPALPLALLATLLGVLLLAGTLLHIATYRLVRTFLRPTGPRRRPRMDAARRYR